MAKKILPRDCSGVRRGERLTNCTGERHGRYYGFTLIELVLVVGIIAVLSALVLSTVGYARKKGARARAETEIAAMSAACENYKADNGIYPTNSDTDTLNPVNELDATSGLDPSQPCTSTNDYTKASLWLYKQISGDTDGDRIGDAKSYFAFKPIMLLPPPPSNCPVVGIRDPFGNSYGYSTRMASTGSGGYNPTFDLWSTANSTDPNQWIKNW